MRLLIKMIPICWRMFGFGRDFLYCMLVVLVLFILDMIKMVTLFLDRPDAGEVSLGLERFIAGSVREPRDCRTAPVRRRGIMISIE